MRVYRWNSLERNFSPSVMREDMAPGERVLMESLQIGKGERVRGQRISNERMICLLKGSWLLKIADNRLVVRRNEAVIIPSGFDHSAEAIEDSFALQMIPQ